MEGENMCAVSCSQLSVDHSASAAANGPGGFRGSEMNLVTFAISRVGATLTFQQPRNLHRLRAGQPRTTAAGDSPR